MIRWVFLDVGNVLLDEDPVAHACFRVHAEAVATAGGSVTFRDLLASREAHAARGSRWPLYDAVSGLLDEQGCAEAWNTADRLVRCQFEALSPLVPGARELVERLGARFRLGLIANQGVECRARLAELGLLDRFEVVALSEEHDLFKPDHRLFLRALEQAGADPSRCAMIGDRLDNDIEPAARLGMTTVWVRWPARAVRGWEPDDDEAIAFRDSLRRSSARAAAAWTGARPTFSVDDLGGIDLERLDRLAASRE